MAKPTPPGRPVQAQMNYNAAHHAKSSCFDQWIIKQTKRNLGSFFPLFSVHSMAANTLFPIPLIPFLLLRFLECYFQEKVARRLGFPRPFGQENKVPRRIRAYAAGKFCHISCALQGAGK